VTDRSQSELIWNKAPCRFCGTGCGVLVATKDGRVVATHGDAKADVNRGLNCVKGYFLSKIMYGEDRLTQPPLRKKNGSFDKAGEFTAVSWDEAFTVMAEKFKAALKKRRPIGGRHVWLWAVDDLGRLCRCQAVQGWVPQQQPRPQRTPLYGFRRPRLAAQLRHRRADGLLRRFRGGRRLCALGLEHGGDASDPVVAHQRSLFTGQKTCIDCHKGIAHRLPKGAHDFGMTQESAALRLYLDQPDK
jgi:hypothetical protein